MGCTIFIIMLTVGILQLNGLNALPVESAAPVLPCTLQEAIEINQKHLQDGENRVSNITTDANEALNEIHEQIEKLEAERTSTGQELLAGLQTTLHEEMQNKPESISCLSALQVQIDGASAKSSYNLAKCTTKTQKKGLKLQNTILKVQKKVQSIKDKAVSSIGKCAISYYPYGSCADLDACCEIEKNKALLKVDKYALKIKYSAEEIVMDVDECLTEVVADTQKYVLYVNSNILKCSPTQPIGPGVNSDESNESGESDEKVAVTQGPEEEVGGIETGATHVPSIEDTQGTEQPQEPQTSEEEQKPEATQKPEEPQGTEQPQEPQTSEEEQKPEATQKPEEPQGTEQPQEPQTAEEAQNPEATQKPEEPQETGTEQTQEAQKQEEIQEPQQPEEPQESQTPEVTQEPELL